MSPSSQVIQPLDPLKLQQAGYNGEEIRFINNAHIHGYSDKEIDDYLSANPVTPPPVDQNALNKAIVRPVTSNVNVPSSYLTDPKANFATDALIENILRPILPKAAASAAAGAGLGVASAPAAIGSYLGIDALLQNLKTKQEPGILSKIIGANKNGFISNIANSAEQAALLKGGERLFGVGKALLGVGEGPEILKFLPTTAQALESVGNKKLSIAVKALEDLSLTAKEKALDRTAGAGFTQALVTSKNSGFNLGRNPVTGAFQNPLNPYTHLNNLIDVTGDLITLPQLDKVITDPKQLEKVLSASQGLGIDTNVKKILQQYQFAKMFNDATKRDLITGDPYTGKVVRINPESFNKVWLDPEMQDSLKKLYNAPQRANIEKFFKNIEYTQDKIDASPIAKKFWIMRGVVGISAGLLTGSLTGSYLAMPVGAVGALISAEGLGRLLTSPKTARIMLALAGKEPLGISEQYAGRVITQVLAGSTIAILNGDGSTIPTKIDLNGKMVPLGSLQQ